MSVGLFIISMVLSSYSQIIFASYSLDLIFPVTSKYFCIDVQIFPEIMTSCEFTFIENPADCSVPLAPNRRSGHNFNAYCSDRVARVTLLCACGPHF